MRYFQVMMDSFREKEIIVDFVSLGDYLLAYQKDYDAIIYNTFPNDTCWKFDHDLTAKCDAKFQDYSGLKILLDTHDNGSQDGFSRLRGTELPRIKVNPSYQAISDLNVILPIPFLVFPSYFHPQEERPVRLVCAMRTQRMPKTRRYVSHTIAEFSPDTDWLPLKSHASRLCRTQVHVVATGNGDSSKSHADTLCAGALLMCQEGLRNIKILPYADLVEDIHFVTFTLDNIVSKLAALLPDRERIDRIRLAGLDAFRVGYDPEQSVCDLRRFISANI